MKTINELRTGNILETSFEDKTLIIESFGYVRFGNTGSWDVLIIDNVNKSYKWDYDKEPKKMTSNRIIALLKLEGYTKTSYYNV
jgi:hypothetical protein